MRNVMIMLLMALSSVITSQEVLDGVVAVVGDEIVLKTDVLQGAQAYAMNMGINPASQPEQFKGLMDQVLQNIIVEKVMLAKAVEDTIVVEDQQVEQELDRRLQGMIDQLGSREKLEEQFGAPIQEIKRRYRDDIRKSMIVQKVQQTKLAGINVSRYEVDQFYNTMKDSLPSEKEKVHLRHILMSVKPGGAAKEKALETMKEIQDRLASGENFGELAKRYSQDPGSAARGGELGFIERGTLFENFEEAAFALEPGEVSQVVETPVGLHLIQCQDKNDESVKVRHILLRLETTEEDAIFVKNKLAEIRQRAIDGESFSDLAVEYSEDTSTKDGGGSLGFIALDEMQIEEFKTAVANIKEGEITEPFRTQFGYHIVFMEEKREARSLSLENDRDQIKEWALNMKRQRVLNEWVEELKKDIYINIKDDMLQ